MHLLEVVLQTKCPNVSINQESSWIKGLVGFAPIFLLLTSIANLILAIVIFRYTRTKNNNDVKIKWFQELIYTPNKEILFAYFSNLNKLKEKIQIQENGMLSEDEKIKAMDLIKMERQKIIHSFVDCIEPISKPLHLSISGSVENLTDDLTNTLDNDELKLNNEKTYNREITNKISFYRNQILLSLFNYKG